MGFHLQPMFFIATLNFFQFHLYFPSCIFIMTCSTSLNLALALDPRPRCPTRCQKSFGILRSRHLALISSSQASTTGSFFPTPLKAGGPGFFHSAMAASKSKGFPMMASLIADMIVGLRGDCRWGEGGKQRRGR